MCFVCDNRYVTQYKKLYHAIHRAISVAISWHLYAVIKGFSDLIILKTVAVNGKIQKQITFKVFVAPKKI